jgi:catechol 2,3-dioxygenase-like lactoylglutathione lyase family enzyme
MIDLVQVFPVRYEEDDGVEEPYSGLMDISQKGADFYNRLFGMELVAGENSPLGDDEGAFDEQVPISALGLAVPKNKKLAPGAAFLVSDFDAAKQVLAVEKITIVEEHANDKFRVAVVSDPDKNQIVIFADLPEQS